MTAVDGATLDALARARNRPIPEEQRDTITALVAGLHTFVEELHRAVEHDTLPAMLDVSPQEPADG